MIYLCYVEKLVDVRDLHEIDTVDTRNIINEMMPKFYDYIVAAELDENPYAAPHTFTTAHQSLYFNEDTFGEEENASRGEINILRDSIES